MVSSMGEVLTPKLTQLAAGDARIQNLFTNDGELDGELLMMALLRSLGPEGFYRKQPKRGTPKSQAEAQPETGIPTYGQEAKAV